MNLVILSGRLTKDGELRTNEGGVSFYHNSIAVKRSYKNADGNYDSDFFNFTLISPGESLVKYLTKGKSVLIRGEIKNNSYEKDGSKKTTTEIMVMKIELIGSKEEKKETSDDAITEEIPHNYKTEYKQQDIQLEDSDLPF